MPVGSDYPVAIVLINRHEPEGEVTGRLLELAEEKGYDPRVVEASRGEHDVNLSFRVPKDVAEAFEADRSDRWAEPDGDLPIDPVTGKPVEPEASEELVDDDNDPNTPPVRKRTAPSKEK
jgi:hypothetical protein